MSSTHLFNWLQQVFPWLYQTHPPPRLTSAGFSMTISNTPIASTDFIRFFHDYIKHTHRLHWFHQVFPWPYQKHPSFRLTSAGFSMTISNTPIASTDFSRFFHDYIKHTHRFDGLQQVFPWLYQTHPSTWLTSAGVSMTMSNRLTSSTDFSRFFHDYINTPIASTDFTRFFHDYIKHTHRLDWLPQVFPWLCQTRTSSTDVNRFFHDYVKHTPLQLTSEGFPMTIKHIHRLDWLQQVFPWLYQT